MTWSTVNSPFSMLLTVPLRLGGTMILCSMAEVSCTVPRTSPPATCWPGSATGTKSHLRSRLSADTWTPRVMVSPVSARISGRGRWIPS